jgi:hypothetical protein
VVVHYDGGRPLPLEAKKVLHEWDEKEAKKLTELGFIQVQADPETVLFVDPTAPPLRDIHTQNVLLRALAPGQTKRFGDLSPEAQRVVRATLTPSVLPMYDLSPDSLVGQDAELLVKFSYRGKRYLQWGHINSGSATRSDFLTNLKSTPMPQAKMSDEELRAAAKEVGGIPSMSMRFSNNLTLSADTPRVFDVCSKALLRLVDQELAERAEIYRAMISLLETANPELRNHPANSWDMDTLPPTLRDRMRRSFVSGWKIDGFESREAAEAAWDGGRVFESGFSFTIGVCIQSNGSNTPELAFNQYAFTGR